MIINLMINIILGLYTGEYDFGKQILFDIPYLSSLLIDSTLVVVYYVWYRKLKKNEPIIKKNRITLKDVGFLILWSFGVIFLVNGLMSLLFYPLEILFPQVVSNYSNMMSSLLEGSLFYLIIRAAILSPITEELVFRGVILKKANYIMPFYAANIVQALLFGLTHLNLIQFIYTFPIGIIFGYITIKYRSVIPSIFMHMLFNAFAVIIKTYKNSLGEPIEFSIWFFVGLTLIGVLLFIVSNCMMKRKVHIYEDIIREIK